VKYEVGVYVPEDDILHSDRRENLKSYLHDLLSLHRWRQRKAQVWFDLFYIQKLRLTTVGGLLS
jgi:hypothetical protein